MCSSWTDPARRWSWTRRRGRATVRATFEALKDLNPVTQVFYEDMELEVHENGARHVYRQRHASRMVFPQELRQPGRAGRRLRALRVVLRLQAAPAPRPGAAPAADGRRAAQSQGSAPAGRAGPQARGGRPRSAPAIRGSIAGRSPISAAAGEPGEVVDVLDSAGHLVGRGIYNPRTSLACRLLTRRGEAVDEALVRRRVAAALGYRAGGRARGRRLPPDLERGRRAARSRRGPLRARSRSSSASRSG